MSVFYRARFPGRKRWRIGKLSHALTPSYGWCLKCKTTWAFVEGHTTDYGNGKGCFPLCEQCWQELGSGEARLPYYVALWHRWERDSTSHEDSAELEEVWPRIEAAVLAESSAP